MEMDRKACIDPETAVKNSRKGEEIGGICFGALAKNFRKAYYGHAVGLGRPCLVLETIHSLVPNPAEDLNQHQRMPRA